MVRPVHRGLLYRFGVFEADVESRELARQGRLIKLQDQPFDLLLLLLEHPGEIVDRDLLRQRLWPENTFVDFGQSLSTALTKLRQALGDDAGNPRFIETIPRRGYRFIAPVTAVQESPPVAPEPPASEPSPVPAVTAPAHPSHPRVFARSTKKQAAIALTSVAILLVCAVIAFVLYRRKTALVLAPKDTIVLADFENTTGEPIFNDTLREALQVGLAQSPIVHVLSDRNAAVVFKQMGHTPEDRIAGRTAIELCKRVGGKVTVQGSISSLGATYLIGLAAIRCDTGRPVAHEQAEAAQRAEVIDALGRVTSRLRARLGESLPSIQKYNAPLEQATTASLDALNEYGLALSTWDAKGDLASLPHFQRAIQLDPEFAMAYGGLATIYNNLGKADLARDSTVKAFNLRERVTESERASIEARYYLYVTEEVDKAEETYSALAQDYPDSAGSLNHLGTTDLRLGRNEQAASDFRKAIQIDPSRAVTYGNLALALLRQNKLAEAGSVLAEADRRGLRNRYWLMVSYWLAFLRDDPSEMRRLFDQSASDPAARPIMLSVEADTEAFNGHFEKARSLSLSAAEQMRQAGDKDSAASCLAQAALRDAQAGFADQARSLSAQALKLSNVKIIQSSSALVAASSGDSRQASSLSAMLDKEYPHGTFVQNYWLPLIRAELDLRRKQGAQAVSQLSSAQALDPSVADGLAVSPLLPAYVRGQAYLAAGDGNRAAAEFQKLIDQRGMVLNSPIGALAHLGLARGYARAGHPGDAHRAYAVFLNLWKDADPGIPILREARAEAALLQHTQ